MNKLLTWIVILVILFFAWKAIGPKVKQALDSKSSPSTTVKTGANTGGCVDAAERASSEWGGGLGRFINPPYDLNDWSSFRGEVDRRISSAEAQCACIEESCDKARNAMRELRSLVSELDAAIRSGGAPPSNAVQRQESIDRQIEEARDLVRAGK